MHSPDERPAPTRWIRARDRMASIIPWGLWGAMSIAMIVYVRQNSRNVPYWDEFAMVPVMTGTEPVSLRWAWGLHSEHRPMISRLVMAGLYRTLGNDFRVVRYANALLLSAMAGSMLLLARRLRGSTRATDALLPLAVLNIAQAECLINGFAMNLILSSLMAIVLIVAAGLARGGGGKRLAMTMGVCLVLLPLSGGSGLTMIPPLALWLAGYVVWGWWSGERPGVGSRVVGLLLLLAGAGVVALYLSGYSRPSYHPLSPTIPTLASATLMFLSLSLYPQIEVYAWPAGLTVALVLCATLVLLAVQCIRSPGERPRALGLIAIILSMVTVAAAVAASRAALGSDRIMSSRYITLATPLLCAVYVAWLVYGRARARLAVHLGLLVLMLLSMPNGRRFSRQYGTFVRNVERRVERRLRDHAPTATVMKLVYPDFHSDRELIRTSFKMLKAAHVGAFSEYDENRVAATPPVPDAVRR